MTMSAGDTGQSCRRREISGRARSKEETPVLYRGGCQRGSRIGTKEDEAHLRSSPYIEAFTGGRDPVDVGGFGGAETTVSWIRHLEILYEPLLQHRSDQTVVPTSVLP